MLGSDTVDELAQEDYYGYSGSYFSVQGLVNTGNAGRLPKVAAYTVIVVVYLLLIGPGIYFYLKKRGIYRYYLPAVTLGAFLFTGIIYALGVKTRFREPFVTYASILDTSGEEAEEATYMNIRSPYNKPYSVILKPGYEVRPMTRSYYYDAVSAVRFTGEEEYHTNFVYQPERVEIKMRDTVAFSPNLFTLRRELEKTDAMGVQGNISYFDGVVSGTVKNCFEEPLENAALLINGKAVLLGRLEPGQTVSLDGKESCDYPVSYSYAAAQMVTGADQYEKAEIEDPDYLKARVMVTLFGGYFGSRLMSNIREEKGYTYGISAGIAPYPGQGILVINTETANEFVEPLVREVYHEIDRLQNDPVPEDELFMVKNYMLGEMCRSYESAFSLADAWMFVQVSGFGDTHFEDALNAVKDITPEEIRELAGRHLCKEKLKEVISGKKMS